MASLRVIRPGLLTTIQDLGRWGQQGEGVPVAGPMDVYSHRAANRLVGNDESAAALEITMTGPELQATADVVCAVAGAVFDLAVDQIGIVTGKPFTVPAGGRLRFGRRLAGARASLAVRGGVEMPAVFGSRSTSLSSAMGPLGGRAIAAGDVLAIGRLAAARPAAAEPPLPLAMPRGGARLRAIPGPQDAAFTPATLDRFFSAYFTVTPASNRMGYRLEGRPLLYDAADMLSEATPLGSVQVPRSGQPILLMADRQTTGGYPKIATVISADLPMAGQLAPGDWVQFARCTRAEAIDLLRWQERRLAGRAT